MINKQNIWFVFLFSVILVLSIIYVGMGSDDISELVAEVNTDDTTLVVNENTELVALRIQSDEEVLATISELQEIILDSESDLQTKNDAYDKLMNINNNKSMEEKIEKNIMEEFQAESFVKINGNNVSVVIDYEKHNYELANKIIKSVSAKFKSDKYVTVKFN